MFNLSKSLSILIILLCFLSFNSVFALSSAGWSDSHKITIPASLVNSSLTNFPVYLDLSDLPDGFFSTVLASGADIRITQSDKSTELPFELVSLDTANGTGELWFKALSLSSATDNDFYLLYGNGTASAYARTDTYGSENVWTQGYLAVYHMNEDPSLTSILDSTSYANHGSSFGTMTSTDLISGQLGSAINFDGVDDYISIPDANHLSVGDGISDTELTLSAWAEQITSMGSIISKSDFASNGEYYLITSGSDIFGRTVDDSTGGYLGRSITRPAGLNYLNFTYNGNGNSTGISLFVNGELISNVGASLGAYTAMENTSHDLWLGRRELYFGGVIDEARISNEIRSTDWIATEHNNQRTPSDFYLIDNGDIDPSEWAERYKITIPATEVAADQTDFPVHLNLSDLPASFFSTVNATTLDIRMTENDALSQIAIEIVDLDTSSEQTGELWFKAPLLSSSSDNIFYLYTGDNNGAAYIPEHPFGQHAVWSNGYLAVYHMSSDLSTTVNSVTDSTSFMNHGNSEVTMTTADSIPGQIGKAVNFDGIDDHISFANTSVANLAGTTQAHISAWGYSNASTWNNFGAFISARTQIILGARQGLRNLRFYLWRDNTNLVASFSDAIPTDIQTWHKYQMRYNGGSLNTYLDGSLVSSDPGTLAINSPTGTAYIGRDLARYLNAGIDEVRVESDSRSTEWVEVEYSNQKSPGNFYLVENGDSAGFDDNFWTNNHKITILASEVNGDLTNFPVYVDLSDLPSSFFSTVDSAGADIRMTINDQMTQTSFELVGIDTVNGTGELWFKAPFLSGTVDTDFYIWFGNPTAEAYSRNDEFGSENVWTEGYEVVWHLQENGNTVASGYNDSTKNNRDGTGVSMTLASDIEGQMGKAQDFDGNSDYIRTPYSIGPYTQATISAWIYDRGSVVSAGPTSDRFFSASTHANRGLDLTTATGANRIAVGAGTSAANHTGVYTNGSVIEEKFSYVSTVVNGTDIDFYIDGVEVPTTVTNFGSGFSGTFPGIDYVTAAGSGNNSPGSNVLGRLFLDELHFGHSLRSADWVKTEYNNQSSPSTFYQIDDKSNMIFWFNTP